MQTWNVKITPDHVFVDVPAAFKNVALVQLNGQYSKREKMYRFPKNYHAMRELVMSFPQLAQNEEFVQTGKGLNAARMLMLDLKDKKTAIQYDKRLRFYQLQDVQYLRQLPAAGIFNEPRTGKTPTTITLIKELGTKRNLIVCPAGLIWNWAKEFAAWNPMCDVFVAYGSPKKRLSTYENVAKWDDNCVLIISKDTLKGDVEKLPQFDLCAVDEAHFLRNYETAQSKAVYKIKAKYRYALTGTPTVKHPSDVFGILRFLYPTRFSSYWQFCERYFTVAPNWMGHMEVGAVKEHRKDELQELIGFASVQRKRKDIMVWLPNKQYITHYCEMESKQKKLYTSMVQDFFAEQDGHEVDTESILTQLMRLRQLCLDPKLLGFDAPSAKTDALLEWLDNNREPVVVMSMFTSYLKMLKPMIEKLGLKVGEIHGQMDNKAKNESASGFQQGNADVLLCNIISAGTGFTLDRAETIIFTDKAWNPSDNEQAEDRVTPTTEAKNHKHTIISFVCQESVDERINKILEDKKSLTDIINNGGMEAIKRLLQR